MEFPHLSETEVLACGMGAAVFAFVTSIVIGRVLRNIARTRSINEALDGNGAWSGDGSGVFVRRNGNIEFIPEGDLDSSVK